MKKRKRNIKKLTSNFIYCLSLLFYKKKSFFFSNKQKIEDQDEDISDDSDQENKEPKNKKSKVEETVDVKISEEIVEVEKLVVKKIETKEERWKRLFTKRTVGKILDSELGDYFRRRNDMLSMKLYIERE